MQFQPRLLGCLKGNIAKDASGVSGSAISSGFSGAGF